jgi:hypothetical protein
MTREEVSTTRTACELNIDVKFWICRKLSGSTTPKMAIVTAQAKRRA